ncbi:MAG TPA: CDP-alcohol phosphatidyltransferase family protein, partial [Kribbellaceae bacterium]
MTGIGRLDDEQRHRALKTRDAWWTVLVIDPLAVRVLPVLVSAPAVTPMRMTGLAAVLGAGSVALFCTGHVVLGAVLFELRFFVDCLDGKLARIRGVASARGAFADLTADVVLVSGAIAGLGWYLVHDRDVPFALPAAVVFGSLVLFWLILYDLVHPVPGRAGVPPTAAPRGLDGWLARHRLERLPRTIEVETGLLFLAPLTGSTGVLVVAYALGLGYYTVAAVALFIL